MGTDVREPILGADFLRHFSRLVDVKHRQLQDGLTQFSVAAPDVPLSPTLQPSFMSFPLSLSDKPVKHSVTHHIRTTGPPVSRRLAPELLLAVSLMICSSWAVLHRVARPAHSTWSPRKTLVTGDHVEITVR